MRVFSRREAAALALGGLMGATLSRRAWSAAQAEVHEVAPGLFVRVGVTEIATAANKDAIANIGFVVGSESVAVIDPGGSLADGFSLREAIRARTNLPIRYVIVTHIHPDHILGCPAFAATTRSSSAMQRSHRPSRSEVNSTGQECAIFWALRVARPSCRIA